jgi:hypothetical protein
MTIMTPGDINARGVDYADRQMQIDMYDPVNAITALAGGGQANAIAVTKQVNRVTTVATIADSIKLPPAVAGVCPIFIINAAANSMNVFPAVGDAINNGAANAALAVAGLKTAIFVCAVNGTWNAGALA